MPFQRFFELVHYNRDWPKYLYHRFTSTQGDNPPLSFALRNGQVIALNRDGRFTLNEIYLDRVYDVPGVNLADCRSILDIGGNVGVFSLFAASVAPQAAIYCFEPAQANFGLLMRNVSTNQGAHIFPYQMAVGGKCGTGFMEVQGASVTHALRTAEATGTDKVEVIDMSRVFELAGVERFDFLKMDVEGAELDILGATSDEQLRRIGAIAMEWHYSERESESLVGRLRGLGFEVTPQFSTGSAKYLKARLRS
jgi:phthiocerol/phenolphthiocerol synthesis type-I polyketide synthase E